MKRGYRGLLGVIPWGARGARAGHGIALLALVSCQPGDDEELLAVEIEQTDDASNEAASDRDRASDDLVDGRHAQRRIPGFDLTITRSGSDVIVAAAPHVGAPTYALWQSEDPYFTPGDPGASLVDSGAASTFTVSGGATLASPTYWRIVADPGAGPTTTSTTVGAWVQPMVPGYTLLTFPLLDTGLLDAQALMDAEPLLTEVWVFDPGTGGFNGFFGTGETNLLWDPGQAIMVTYGGPGATEHRQFGHVPLTSDTDRTLDTGLNLLTVPLLLAPTDAAGLGGSVPTLQQIGDWNTATQVLDVFGLPAWGINFDIDPGQGVWLWSTGAGPWPPDGTVSVCGDGLVDPVEWCDDGNGLDADGCETTCVLTPPTTGPDAYVAAQDTSLSVSAASGLLADDVAYDGTAVVVLSADAQSAHGGSITMSVDGSFDYDPPAGYWGEDSFTYTVQDAYGATAEGQVELVVRPINVPLTAIAGGLGGFSIDGENQFDSFGSEVSGAGDVDGDGLADVVVGAYAYVQNNIGSAGRTYVVHGKTTTEPLLGTDIAAGQGGFVIEAHPLSGYMGRAVSGIGDVDGDGLDDLLTTAPNAYTRGELYVVHGREQTTPVQATNVAAGFGGYLLEAEVSSFLGYSADGAGDVDGDGVPDFVVSDYRSYLGQYETNMDRSYVVFGQAGTTPVSTADVAAGLGGFVIDNETTGNDHTVISVAGAGDVDGDGLQDLVLGAGAADYGGQNSGRSYVVFGKAGGSPVSLAALGGGGFVIDGQLAGDASGYSVEGAGDVNGDGLDDVVIGAYAADPHGSASGSSYVVFGKADGQPVDLDDVAAGIGGFAMHGTAATEFTGQAVAGVGDLDGDGLDDLAVGARLSDVGGNNSGRVYVVYGRTDTTPVELSDVAQGIGGFTLDGAGSEQAGGAVDAAGDVNGDGLDDLVVGAAAAEPNGFFSGRVYVVFGSRSSL